MTYVKKKTIPHGSEYWDEKYYITDFKSRKTISHSISQFAASYHYASIEMIITKYFFDYDKSSGNSLKLDSVLDIGCGSGHWIDFYEKIGAAKLMGVDVSAKSIEHLKQKYKDDDGKDFNNSSALQFLQDSDKKFDVINAIGVIFHIVDDEEWEHTLEHMMSSLEDGGILVIGGQFGFLNNINVQINLDGEVNKRLRSRANFEKTLKRYGARQVDVVYNNNSFLIDRVLPENNILFAIK